MDSRMAETVEKEILNQLECCCRGEITPQELQSAKEALISSLLSIPDSPGTIENYYATGALSGMQLSIPQYMEQVQQVTLEKLVVVARKIRLHSVFLLKGVQ